MSPKNVSLALSIAALVLLACTPEPSEGDPPSDPLLPDFSGLVL